jgi:hypothetical protein
LAASSSSSSECIVRASASCTPGSSERQAIASASTSSAVWRSAIAQSSVFSAAQGPRGEASATSTSASTTSWRSTTVTGFTETFLMATGFLVLCFGAGLLVPKIRGAGEPPEPGPALVPEGAQA